MDGWTQFQFCFPNKVLLSPLTFYVLGRKFVCKNGDAVAFTNKNLSGIFQPMRIHSSSTTREALKDFPYIFEVRGEVDVKVRGVSHFGSRSPGSCE